MRTALDIVRGLVAEEQRLAQRQLADARRLEVVRAQLDALRRLAGIAAPSPRRARPAEPSSSARPTGRKVGAARARRSPARRPGPPAPAEERPVRAELIERAARGAAIRELLAKARAEEAAEQAAEQVSAAPPVEPEERPRRAYSERQSTKLEPGATFGCWVVVREVAPDAYGRTRYLARASCCGREANKTPATLRGRGKEKCSKCTPHTHVGIGIDGKPGRPPRRANLGSCRACGERGHNSATCHVQEKASIWLRCKAACPVTTGQANVQAQPFTRCGSLVLRTRAAEHLAEVHELEVGAAELAQHFEAVDPRQGMDEP